MSQYLNRTALSLLLPLCLFVVSNQTLAAEDKGLARAQQMLRQLNSDNAQLQQEIAKIRQEYTSYRAEAEKKVAAAETKAHQLEGSVAVSSQDSKDLGGKLKALQKSHENEQKKTHQIEQTLAQQLQTQKENLETCQIHNAALADTANELIGLYQNKGFAEVLKKREPVTGIAKVKVENIVQQYQDRVMEHQLEKNPQPLNNVEASPENEKHEDHKG